MGYDDNTPLTGVTGGGLPAEIWQDTMLRVHEGLPARPLPMAQPAPEQPVAQNRQPRRQQRRENAGDAAERIIREVLGRILGGR
jgi:membrane peptidoglycan carboxypeptidase